MLNWPFSKRKNNKKFLISKKLSLAFINSFFTRFKKLPRTFLYLVTAPFMIFFLMFGSPLMQLFAEGGAKVEMSAEVITPTHLFTNVQFTGCTVPYSKVVLFDNDEDRIYVQQDVDETGQFDRLTFVLDRIEDKPKNFSLYAEYKAKKTKSVSFSFKPTTYEINKTTNIILPPIVDQEYEEIREEGEMIFFAYGCPESQGNFFFRKTNGQDQDFVWDADAMANGLQTMPTSIQSFIYETDKKGFGQLGLKGDLEPGNYEIYSQLYGEEIFNSPEDGSLTESQIQVQNAASPMAQPPPEVASDQIIENSSTAASSSSNTRRYSTFSQEMYLEVLPSQVFSGQQIIGGSNAAVTTDLSYIIDWLIILFIIIIIMLFIIMIMLYFISKLERHQQLLISHLGILEDNTTFKKSGLNTQPLVSNFMRGMRDLNIKKSSVPNKDSERKINNAANWNSPFSQPLDDGHALTEVFKEVTAHNNNTKDIIDKKTTKDFQGTVFFKTNLDSSKQSPPKEIKKSEDFKPLFESDQDSETNVEETSEPLLNSNRHLTDDGWSGIFADKQSSTTPKEIPKNKKSSSQKSMIPSKSQATQTSKLPESSDRGHIDPLEEILRSSRMKK